ncbi:M81 family metallopeptidase [Bryobacter aggregatus]|uniref:M81 family metallopeptidase n=1 Tax=Bryobacter aggregatus TaxID=360054 RepID=UPI0004E1C6EF|nr:M81 family metallopeptidase [Bryobacter aggregatus]
MPRVAVACLMHESNSFHSRKTRYEDFHFLPREVERWKNSSTEVAGFIEESLGRGMEILPLLHGGATPSGPVERASFEQLAGEIVQALHGASFDAVYLALHGAMFAEGFPHADEEIVRRVRHEIGPAVPLVVTHDFHANLPPGLLELCDALVVYQQNPHLDTKERGERAARILADMLSGAVRPVQRMVKPPMLWNIVHQNTYRPPLQAITEASIALEREPGILAVSVVGGYQYNDVPFLGPSVVVIADGDGERAAREAQRLSEQMWAAHESLHFDLPDAAKAVRDALSATEFPVALFDVGDNIGGGAAGDATFLFEQLLAQEASGFVVTLYDPEAVAEAKRVGIDGAFAMFVGGKTDTMHGVPIGVKGHVVSLHAGRYVEPEVRHGGTRFWSLGHAAVVALEGSTPELPNLLLLTAERSSPNSIHQLVSCGIYPERMRILTVKGTVAPVAAYRGIAKQIVMVDTPGATTANPSRFTFHRAPALWGL